MLAPTTTILKVGCVIPGRPLMELTPNAVDTVAGPVGNPCEVSQIAAVLLAPLPADDLGVGLHFSIAEPFDSWEFFGVLTNARPSDCFSVPWAFMPEVAGRPFVALKAVLEPASALVEKIQLSPPVDVRKVFVEKVALNLFRYVESLSLPNSNNVQAILDQWYTRFQEKYKKDPMFVLRVD